MMTLWIAALAVAAQAPTFEVASVKPANPPAGPHVVSLIISHGRLNIEAAELRQIVGLAYAVQRIRVVGGPVWADSDQFDIVAKAESDGATRDEIRTMLQVHDRATQRPGWTGYYDYTFEWPDAASSLFASADQLGLKLEAKKVPVEILVMDRAEHPSAN